MRERERAVGCTNHLSVPLGCGASEVAEGPKAARPPCVRSLARQDHSSPPCVSGTAFGAPVEPDVNMIAATASGAMPDREAAL